MAKKNNTMTYVIVGLAIGVIAYILMKGQSTEARQSGGGNGFSNLPEGCYPFEEVHEASTSGEMWLSIIPYMADGTTSARPPSGTVNIGDSVSVSNTGSALDTTYTIKSIYYSPNTGDIGSFRVDIPSGYNFNYNAWQGDYDPRDMTYFGKGNICLT